jgi:predicted nucleic acid-binding protein
LKPTYLDADILIAAAKGTEVFSAPALEVLDDPERSFACSDYVKLEVLPNAAYFERTGIVAFYEEFFESVERWVPSSPELSARALDLACQHGLGAMDALHVAAAEAAGAELLTAESPTKPMFRVGPPRVVSIRTAEPGETS